MHNLTNNNSLIPCKNYLIQPYNYSKLTIIDKIELKFKLYPSFIGRNFFEKSQFGPMPIKVKKGYVPVIKRNKDTWLILTNEFNTNFSDYFCTNFNMSLNITSQLVNFTQINSISSGKSYRNVAINFVFNYPNQTLLTNYTLNHVFNLFGTFPISINTIFSGIYLNNPRKKVNVQRISSYPFQSIEINQFNLNCSLNEMRLDCILRVNLSNYANSFQQITIDYGDGISFDSFMINSYCKYYIIII